MNDTETSLALCQRYATLNDAQRVLHDVEAVFAPPELQRLMPQATRDRLMDPEFVEAAHEAKRMASERRAVETK